MATDYKKNAQEAKAIAKANPAAAKVIAQATKTGEGLSNNELTFIRNNASKITAKTNPVAFLGTLQSRLDANAAVAAQTGGGTPTGGGNVVDPGVAYAQARTDAERRSAYAILEDTFKAYNLEELVPEIKRYLQQGLSAEEATLQLRQTPTYKTRFQGNEGRIAKGLAAYSPAEYLAAEESYANLLNSNNLSGLANKPVFTKLISGAVSPLEVQDRINKVFNKIDNARDDVKRELGRYFSQYNVNDPNAQRLQLAESILSGEDPAMKLEEGVKKAQLRAGATAAGYVLPEQRVESIQKLLSEAGVSDTYATGQQGFQTLAQIEPTTTKLADIYKEAPVSEEELQKEAFLGLKSERRKKLGEKEQATFSGQAGTTQVSLAQQGKGTF